MLLVTIIAGVILAIILVLLVRTKMAIGVDLIDKNSKERSGRIDIYSQDLAFELKDVKAGGTVNIRHYYAHWLIPNDQRKHWIVEGPVDEEWRNIWIEFTSSYSGYVLINLRGSFYEDVKKMHHDVWVDDFEIEGATVENGGFEMIGPDAKPAYWGWNGSPKRYSTDGSVARSGRCCVLIWHDTPLIQKIEVAAGKRYKISAWFKAYSQLK